MMRGTLALIALMLTLLIVARGILPTDELAEKAPRQATVYYELSGDDKPLRFAIPKGISEIRLETRMMIDRRLGPIMPIYNVNLHLEDDQGEILMDSELHLRAERSQGDLTLQTRAQRETIIRDEHWELTDNRMTYHAIPGGQHARRILSISWAKGVQMRGLIRLFGRQHLPDWEQYLQQQASDTSWKVARAHEIGYRPWNLLTSLEQRKLSQARWLRLEAEGVGGRDYQTRAAWQELRGANAADLGQLITFDLTPWRDAAYNLRGPGQVTLIRDGEAGSLGQDYADSVAVYQVGANAKHGQALKLLRRCSLPWNGARCELPIETSHATTLHIQTSPPGFMGIRLQTQKDGAKALGEVPAIPSRNGGTWIGPDIRLLTVFRSDASLNPLELQLADPDGAYVALVLRPLMGHQKDRVNYQITARFETADGELLLSDVLDLVGEPSRFEFYPDAPSIGVGERQMIFLKSPARAQRLLIESDHPVDLQFYERQFWEDQAIPEPPYLWDHLEGFTLRYPPMAHRRWQSIYPADIQALWLEGRAIRLAAQVRLEPQEMASEAGHPPPNLRQAKARSLRPRDGARRHELLEPLSPAKRAAVDSDLGLFFKVPLARSFKAQIRGGLLSLYHRIAYAHLREEIHLYLNDQSAGSASLLTSMGSAQFGPIDGGSYTLKIDSPPGDYFMAGLPHDPTIPTYKKHPVYALRRGDSLTVDIPGHLTPGHLGFALYAPDAYRGEIQLISLLDDGRPAIKAGRLHRHSTQALRRHRGEVTDGQAAIFLNQKGQFAGPPLYFSHQLGADLKNGAHRVKFTLDSGPNQVWLRFYMVGAQGPAALDARPRREVQR